MHSRLTFDTILSIGLLDRVSVMLLLKLFAYEGLLSFKTSSDFSLTVPTQGFFYNVRKPHLQIIFNCNDVYMTVKFDN